MNPKNVRLVKLLIPITFILLLTSCTAGNSQFTTETPAGFWYGLWHGMIAFISLVIHVFNDGVRVYEINNTGGWYDLGFLLGATCIWGGGSHASCKSSAKRKREKDWELVRGLIRANSRQKCSSAIAKLISPLALLA